MSFKISIGLEAAVGMDLSKIFKLCSDLIGAFPLASLSIFCACTSPEYLYKTEIPPTINAAGKPTPVIARVTAAEENTDEDPAEESADSSDESEAVAAGEENKEN